MPLLYISFYRPYNNILFSFFNGYDNYNVFMPQERLHEKNPPPRTYVQAAGGGLLSFRYYSAETLYLGDDTYFCCFKELDDAAHGITVRHLLLNLVYGIQHSCLSMEDKAIGIGNMSDDFL